MSKLWKWNRRCPTCGKMAYDDIRSCETGYSYCSDECAKIHVHENAPEEGY